MQVDSPAGPLVLVLTVELLVGVGGERDEMHTGLHLFRIQSIEDMINAGHDHMALIALPDPVARKGHGFVLDQQIHSLVAGYAFKEALLDLQAGGEKMYDSDFL